MVIDENDGKLLGEVTGINSPSKQSAQRWHAVDRLAP